MVDPLWMIKTLIITPIIVLMVVGIPGYWLHAYMHNAVLHSQSCAISNWIHTDNHFFPAGFVDFPISRAHRSIISQRSFCLTSREVFNVCILVSVSYSTPSTNFVQKYRCWWIVDVKQKAHMHTSLQDIYDDLCFFNTYIYVHHASHRYRHHPTTRRGFLQRTT